MNYINKLMRRLTWCSVKYKFCIYAEYLPGKSNVIANALSRFQNATFQETSVTCRQATSTVPAAIQGDVEIRGRIRTLMEQSVTQSTKQVYDCGFDTYRKCMLLCNITWNSTLPPISEYLLMKISIYCHQSLYLSYSTTGY